MRERMQCSCWELTDRLRACRLRKCVVVEVRVAEVAHEHKRTRCGNRGDDSRAEGWLGWMYEVKAVSCGYAGAGFDTMQLSITKPPNDLSLN